MIADSQPPRPVLAAGWRCWQTPKSFLVWLPKTAMIQSTQETVVFVHGLYMTGLEMALLRRRVSQAGFDTHQFHYHTVLESVDANAKHLADYITKLDASTVHLVGHSLGGMVILRMFESGVRIPPGRVVLMGSPVRGSMAARNLTQKNWGWLLGQSGPDGLADTHDPVWDQSRELGVFIGTGGTGFGLPRPELTGVHDGVVTAEETQLPGATDQIALPVHHTSMLFQPEVAEQVIQFLKQGRFKH
ncbi:MAG TPA: alpha/beta hydrolase [Gammaproteobacteria bacterium]|nr:alpha/beta hydrolase [Gammaproteobacteria bacterium]